MAKRLMVCGHIQGQRLVSLRYFPEPKAGQPMREVLSVYWKAQPGVVQMHRRHTWDAPFDGSDPRPAA